MTLHKLADRLLGLPDDAIELHIQYNGDYWASNRDDRGYSVYEVNRNYIAGKVEWTQPDRVWWLRTENCMMATMGSIARKGTSGELTLAEENRAYDILNAEGFYDHEDDEGEYDDEGEDEEGGLW